MKNKIPLLILLCVGTYVHAQQIITIQPSQRTFPLPEVIYIDQQDDWLVGKAAELLKEDVRKVMGRDVEVVYRLAGGGILRDRDGMMAEGVRESGAGGERASGVGGAGKPGVGGVGEPRAVSAGKPGVGGVGEPGAVGVGETGAVSAGKPGVGGVGKPGAVGEREPGTVSAGKPGVADARQPRAEYTGAEQSFIFIGTLKSSLVKELNLDTSGLTGKWEAFRIEVTPGRVIILGSDKRGAAYGALELSRQLGVSPWYWWADVPVKKKEKVYVREGRYDYGPPSVQYRGIFINDEAPAFSGWTHEKFGGFNHLVYEKVFELLLRLRGNYLWPAMWGNAFNKDDTLNPILADKWGIVMGTSHHEPMLRAQQEWKRYGKGAWDYSTNKSVLRDFWREGIVNMGKHESIVTVGMRGDGDMPMSNETATDLLERIVKDQRQIISEVTGRPAAETPQMWALYKEVQDYYDKGMRVPEDVTLLLCDDNWGNIRRLPEVAEGQMGQSQKMEVQKVEALTQKMQAHTTEGQKVQPQTMEAQTTEGQKVQPQTMEAQTTEGQKMQPQTMSAKAGTGLPAIAKRKGGYGIYYHFDYVGDPRNYKWINTNNLARVWEQFHLAKMYGADKVWIVNVGDLKPMELPISFFMHYAWATEDTMRDWYSEFAAENFGEGEGNFVKGEENSLKGNKNFVKGEDNSVKKKENSGQKEDIPIEKKIGTYLRQYSEMAARRKPELLDEYSYPLEQYKEIVNDWAILAHKVRLQPQSDAYFQLVQYPVEAMYNLHRLYYAVALYKTDNIRNKFYADSARAYYKQDSLLTVAYHQMGNGKWNHMMDQTHIGYTGWQQPPVNKMPDLSGPYNPTVILPKIYKRIPATDYVAKHGDWQILKGIGKFGDGMTSFAVNNSEIKTVPDSEMKSVLKSETKSLPKSEIESVTESEAKSLSKSEAKSVPDAETKSLPKSEIKSVPDAEAKSLPKSEIKSVPDAEVKSLPKSEIKSVPDSEIEHVPVSTIHPKLKYEFQASGDIYIYLNFSPTLNFPHGKGLTIGISIDGEKETEININGNDDDKKIWEQWVANNIIQIKLQYSFKPGKHELLYTQRSPGIVFQSIELERK